MQIGDTRNGWAFPVPWAGAAAEMIRTYPWLLMWHSAYDWRVLKRHLDIEPRWAVTEDGMIAARIADSLKKAALKIRTSMDVDSRAMSAQAQLDGAMKKQGWDWDTVPGDFPPFAEYAAMDTCLTALWWERYGHVARRYHDVYDLERSVARICARMMDTGLLVDVPYVHARTEEYRAELGRVMTWLRDNYGITTVNSNDQVGAALERAGITIEFFTDGGKPSIARDALTAYKSMYPQHEWLLTALLRARRLADITGKYLSKFLDMRGPDDVMHYSINTMAADTHRQSVSEPPLQQLYRDEPSVRGSFIPRPGNAFLSVDMDQVEARLAAVFSEDPRMLAEFRRCDEQGLSFFVETASRIYGEPVSKSDPRYTWTKNGTYAQIYGSSLRTAARTFGITEDALRPSYDGFRRMYPGVDALMQDTIAKARRRARPGVETYMGRTLHCRRGKEYVLQDYRIQGSAGELFKLSMVALDAAGYGEFLRLPMHDEHIAEVPAEHAEEILRGFIAVLTDRESFPIPITWGGSVLPERWAKT